MNEDNKKKFYTFTFSEEDCIDCRACEVACRTWFAREAGVFPRRIYEWFSGSYPDTTLHKLSVSCLQCEEAACVEACPTHALTKDDDGIVRADRDTCIGCRKCLNVCPVQAPQFGSDKRIVKCEACMQEPGGAPCVLACPSGALQLQLLPAEEKRASDQNTVKLFSAPKTPF